MFFGRKKAASAFEPSEPLDAAQSPVSWISHEVWQRRKQWSRFPLLKSAADGPLLLSDADPVAIDAGWRESRPMSAARAAAPPAMTVTDARLALEKTEDAGAFWNPVSWPMCCGSLTVLVLVNPTRSELEVAESVLGSLEGACPLDGEGWHNDLTDIRAGVLPENGVNVFQCGGCGRTYGHHSHT
jgi:hypothetical protein